MPVKDIRSDLVPEATLIEVISASTTTTGAIIDTAAYDGGIVMTLGVAKYTDGTYNFAFAESDASNMGSSNAIADANMIGTEAGLVLSAVSADNAVLPSIGFVGTKRYIQVTVTSTAVTTGATVFGVAMKRPEVMPATGLSA